jgi:predicted Zn-dependent protease
MRFLLLIAVICLSVPLSAQEPLGAQESSSSAQTEQAIPAASPGSKRILHSETDDAGKAEAAIVKDDWKTAEPLLDAWLAAHPDDASALFDAGYVADAQGRNDDAIALYQKALKADEKSFEAEISLGLLLARLGRASEAQPILEKATAMDADPAEPKTKAKAWRALAQIEMGKPDGPIDTAKASADLLEALKLTPETPADTLLAARIADVEGETAAAEAAYRLLLKDDPDSSVAVAGLAHIEIAAKKYPEAEELLQTALKKAPDDPALTAQLAAVLVAEDKADALTLLQEFHQKHSQEAAITRMLAQVEADAGDYAESDQLYLGLLPANPKDAELLVGHGQNLIRLRRYPDALKAFESATQIDEANGEAWNGLAFAAFETHQPSITLHALTVRSKYLPESATIYFLWATAYDTLHDKKQASAYYRRFLESAAGKFPDQEWQARQRLTLLEKSP